MNQFRRENSYESRTMGIKFLMDVRKLKNEKKLPVIILTVYSDEKIKKQAYEAGCNEYLEKPCLPSKLLEEVNKYLK